MRILVVEDYPATALLFKMLLSKVAATDVVADAEEALVKSNEHTYDFFLVDIQLGGGKRTGLQFLYDLREIPRYSDTPVIACTADVMPEHREKYLAHGFTGFLGKPFARQDLLDLIERHTAG